MTEAETEFDRIPASSRAQFPLRSLLILTVVIDLVGVLMGVLWWWWSPVAEIKVEADGAYFVDPVPHEFITADLRFAVLSVVFGAAVGFLVHRVLRGSDLLAVLLLAANGMVVSLIAWQLGAHLGHVDLEALKHSPAGTVSPVSLELTALGFLVLFPVTALGSWLTLDLWGDFRRRNDPPPLAGYAPAPYVELPPTP